MAVNRSATGLGRAGSPSHEYAMRSRLYPKRPSRHADIFCSIRRKKRLETLCHIQRSKWTRWKIPNMTAIAVVVTLLIASNLFMTYAWYGHLKDLAGQPW